MGLRRLYVGVFIDDVIIYMYSHTCSDHLRHLEEVLEHLQFVGITLKLKKCTIATSECTYVGHEVGHASVQPEQAKLLHCCVNPWVKPI